MDGRSVSLVLITFLDVGFTICVQSRPVETEILHFQCESPSPIVIACCSFMHFGHDESCFVAGNAFKEYLCCGPSMEFSVHDDVMRAASLESSCLPLLGRQFAIS